MRFSILTAATAITAVVPGATAYWRLQCPSRLLQERIDPIISPGYISAHMHTVAGGNGFGFTMNYEQARASQCSSCPVKQDLSNYWTPKLYYHAENGSFIGVPQMGDWMDRKGGMTIYYLQRLASMDDVIKAFPPGFQMIAGNPFKRNFTGDFAAQAISFVCLDENKLPLTTTNGFPDRSCPGGLKTQVFFPTCWDGVNVSSEDNSHVAYPESGTFDRGPCPSTHPVHIIALLMETIYQTDLFSNMWYGDRQPFVLAQGDATGYGMHGDFVNGWDIDTLQKAIDNCIDGENGELENCPYFDLFTDEECARCKVPVVLNTNIDGPRNTLPGCNPVTYGPEPVTPPEYCDRYPAILQPTLPFTNLLAVSWKYVGCGSDNATDRTFTGSEWMSENMTVIDCVNHCKSEGFEYAGVEYATMCFCDNSIRSDRAPVEGVLGNCDTPCGGNADEVCGGGMAMSIYKTCVGNTCANPSLGGLVGGMPKRPPMNKKRHVESHLARHARRHQHHHHDF